MKQKLKVTLYATAWASRSMFGNARHGTATGTLTLSHLVSSRKVLPAGNKKHDLLRGESFIACSSTPQLIIMQPATVQNGTWILRSTCLAIART